MKSNISYNEWLTEVGVGYDPGPGWLSVSEMCKETGRSRDCVARDLARMRAAGRLEESMKQVIDSAGRRQVVRCYRILAAGEKKPAKKKKK